jgi:general secretion pathway protein I
MKKQMSGRRRSSNSVHRAARAFTLIEVMVALLIFFMAVFTILGLLSNTLRNARALQRKNVDAGMVAAESYFKVANTNRVAEGAETGDFGDSYPDHEWTTDTYEAETNGLYRVDILVQRQPNGVIESRTAILIFNGNAPGSLSRGVPR